MTTQEANQVPMKCQACSTGKICKGQVQTVHVWDGVKDWGLWDYCESGIISDCIKGFQVYDLEGNIFEYVPEQLNKIPPLTESQLSDLYYEEYKAEQYINEMKADGLL